MLPTSGTLWAGLWLFFATPPTDVLSFTAVAALAVLAVLAAGALLRAAALVGTGFSPATIGAVTTGAAHGVARLCDPDAAGRPRPRAPTAGLAA